MTNLFIDLPLSASAKVTVRDGPQTDRIAVADLRSAPILFNENSGTAYTLRAANAGRTLIFSDGSPVSITIPAGLGKGYHCKVVNLGSGTVSFSGSGVTLNASGSTDIVQYTGAEILATEIDTFLCRKELAVGSVCLLDVADQTISGGANVTALSLGTKSTGTLTIDCGSRPLQYVTNGGAFTLASPSAAGSCVVLVTNNGSAGAITFSGFSVGSNTGDALTTTNAEKFSIFVWRVNGVSGYRVAAHQ